MIMINWQVSVDRLNRIPRVLEGDQLTFHTYYWGAEQHLPANVVHKHSFFEICYVDGGSGVYTEEGKTYPLYEGVAFCSRPGIYHQIKDVNGLDLLFVTFEPIEEHSSAEKFSRYYERLERGSVWLDKKELSPIVQLWKSMLAQSEPGGIVPSSVLPQLASSLLASFPNLFSPLEHEAELPSPRANAAHLIRRAKLYIRDNLASSLTLPDIARYLSISERHLSRLFASGIHESFSATVRLERIRAAEKLLGETEIPIKEIAEQVGFSTVHYFTRTFSQAKGVPPAAYREASRRNALFVQH
ncbi:AraC family transcriptional regulator [Paenibacillus sp. YIM B09110]|uniref:AraC family transcriptional regulator n=1 Tax=Paenibacillus sp. YIM B09110 TaxID=3126102 RepID=UPI00301BB507